MSSRADRETYIWEGLHGVECRDVCGDTTVFLIMCTKERFKIFVFGVQAKIGGRFSRILRLPVEIHLHCGMKGRKGNGMHGVLGSSLCLDEAKHKFVGAMDGVFYGCYVGRGSN
jgi:hypothetical protein